MKYRALLFSSLLLSACVAERVNTIPQNEVASTSSVIEQTKNSSSQNNVLNALIGIHFDVPANWNESEPQLEGPYARIELTSPNYQEIESGDMCDETVGAKIVIMARNQEEGMETIDESLLRGPDSEGIVSKMKKVNVDNNTAVEYVWSWECAPRLITDTVYNGVRYSIYLSDVARLSEYASQYYGIINSISFVRDTNS